MQPHKNNNGFLDRLTACVERTGGKRALAAAALISEAQLFRYLNGESDVPSDRLVAIAKAAKVDAGWLLAGSGTPEGIKVDPRPRFRAELMVQVVQTFEELLIEFEKPFSPKQRARAITFLYNALRHEEVCKGILLEPQKFDMLKYLDFLSELRTEEELEVLINSLDLLEYSAKEPPAQDRLQLLRTWCNLLVRGTKGYYSSYAGKVYFERKSGGHLAAEDVLELQNLVLQLYKIVGKSELDWLDAGCGNGQHLVHLYKHMPNLRLKGLELSQLGYSMCKELMDSERLPKDSITMADMRHMPYASQSFDIVFAHMSMYSLPFIPGSGLGLEEALGEVARVLRPGGALVLVMPEGHHRDYLLPRQYLNEAQLQALAAPMFTIASCTSKTLRVQAGAMMPDRMKFACDKLMCAILTRN